MLAPGRRLPARLPAARAGAAGGRPRGVALALAPSSWLLTDDQARPPTLQARCSSLAYA